MKHKTPTGPRKKYAMLTPQQQINIRRVVEIKMNESRGVSVGCTWVEGKEPEPFTTVSPLDLIGDEGSEVPPHDAVPSAPILLLHLLLDRLGHLVVEVLRRGRRVTGSRRAHHAVTGHDYGRGRT